MTMHLRDRPGRHGDYLARTPERLVLEGYRHWIAGYDNNSVIPWELAWGLYERILGAEQAKTAVAELASYIRIVGRCATCPLKSFPSGAHHLCREECLTLAMIAGAQHSDELVVRKCLDAMTCPTRCDAVAMAAGSFALTLRAMNQKLLPIPVNVVDDIISRGSSKTVH